MNCRSTRWVLATLLFLSGFDAVLAQETSSTTHSIDKTAQRNDSRDSPPEPPRHLRIVSASPGSPSGTQVTLEWDPNAEPVAEYRIYYDDDGSGLPYTGTGASEGTSPIVTDSVTLTITGLSNTETTYFAATAIAGIEESDYSNEVSYTPPDTTPPIITSGPTVDSKTTTTATVTWTTDEQSNSIIGYGTLSSTWNDYPFQSTDGEMTTDHQIIIAGLEPGTEYFLRVGSTDPAANGPTVSEEVSFETDTEADTTLPEVTITSPTSNSTYSTEATSVTLGGTASDNVGVTHLTWSNDSGGSGEATGTTDWSTSTITLYSGENVVTITAFDEAGNSGEDSITITCVYAHECPDCSGDQVTLEELIFKAGTDCSCIATVSMTIGSGVIVKEGATLTVSSPEINIQAGFHAERGANIRISHQ